MPTYDYKCDACEHTFETFQSMTAKLLRKCPECGKPKLRRLIGTGAGILFKGSGFYETDYRSSSYKEAAKKDKPSSDSASKKDSKKDSKPTPKKDTSSGSDSSS